MVIATYFVPVFPHRIIAGNSINFYRDLQAQLIGFGV